MKNIYRISGAILLIFLIHFCKKSDDNVIKDGDGNVYTSVKIDTQVWIVENLKTTKYNDGIAIPLVTDNSDWGNLTTSAYCWYTNDAAANKSTYGSIYNWYAVNTGKLCPTGWHVPTDEEWTILINYLGGGSVAGNKLKEAGTIHWISPNAGTNESGFTALPGGRRTSAGIYVSLTDYGYWWSSTESSSTMACVKLLT